MLNKCKELAATKMNASMIRQPLTQVLSDIIDAFDSFFAPTNAEWLMLQSAFLDSGGESADES